MKDLLGSPLFYTLMTFVVTALVRGLKTTRIPKSVLPWAALVLGFALGVIESLASGSAWQAALLDGLKGLASGSGAVATNETLSTIIRGAFGEGAVGVLFGKRAGPSSLPANIPTVSVPAAIVVQGSDARATPSDPVPGGLHDRTVD